ncbi:hypothetical protein X768_21475 [Mesorhizobium sp. LSJC265A00]|nr:hypothetical protein X768_21475 [Mesorhizobium sp. LSJC265A00]ESY09604.1 hypothetical protein X752_18880 [Mesorhizobium sp. LNJC398B00]ESZ55722.1 hypothetical protein X729_26000 [Mesorhizobium sp. L103C131B0]
MKNPFPGKHSFTIVRLHNSVLSRFLMGKFVKGAHHARITKVGQTNIDMFLIDFF